MTTAPTTMPTMIPPLMPASPSSTLRPHCKRGQTLTLIHVTFLPRTVNIVHFCQPLRI